MLENHLLSLLTLNIVHPSIRLFTTQCCVDLFFFMAYLSQPEGKSRRREILALNNTQHEALCAQKFLTSTEYISIYRIFSQICLTVDYRSGGPVFLTL